MLFLPLSVITGPTAGIGYEFSKQLAKAGFNVLLVGRDPTKLASLKSEIGERRDFLRSCSVSPTDSAGPRLPSLESATPEITVQTHRLDFGSATEADFHVLSQEIAQLPDVGVLINNVGRSHAYPEYLTAMPKEECDQILKLNVEGLVNMTRIVVPKMTAQSVCFSRSVLLVCLCRS